MSTQKPGDNLDAEQYASPEERKEPINDATHVRSAIARFDQVKGVSVAKRLGHDQDAAVDGRSWLGRSPVPALRHAGGYSEKSMQGWAARVRKCIADGLRAPTMPPASPSS